MLSSLFQLLFAQNPIGDNGSNSSYVLFQEEQFEQVVSNLEKQSKLSADESIILQLSYLKIGGTNTSDIEKLIKKVKSKVLEKTGINLELEIKIIGD